ncbi:MAG: cytochrome ubiquinol oxidase subunit I [Dehalococcoidia bacterium]
MFDTVTSARALMGTALGFHILFATVGIGLPPLLFAAEGLYLRTGKEMYRDMARRWAVVVGVLFAVGAVSGTILSFSFGLLWPSFTSFSGGIIGLPFFLEGFAFFTEAIFLGLYLYGWKKLSPKAHWLTTIPIAVAALASAFFIISANSWMNQPTGFDIVNGVVTNVNPTAAMLTNRAFPYEFVHGALAAYVALGLGVAGIYALAMLRGDRSDYNKKALMLGLGLAAVFAPLQVVTGDLSARAVAHNQPEKFAAMEGQFATQRGAPLRIGGIPFPGDHETKFAIEIPKLASLLAFEHADAEIKGLDSFPQDEIPNVWLAHFPFQLMVALGFTFVGVSALFWGHVWWKKRVDPPRLLLAILVLMGVLGFFAIEMGWFVTEFGRQPWMIYHVMRTEGGATSRSGIWVLLVLFGIVYVALAIGLAGVLLLQQRGRTKAPRAG